MEIQTVADQVTRPVLLRGFEESRCFFSSKLASNNDQVWVAHLDVHAVCIMSAGYEGDIVASKFPLREILVDALLLESAGIILVSANSQYNENSRLNEVKNLAEALESAGMTLVDVFIVNHNVWRSLRREGML